MRVPITFISVCSINAKLVYVGSTCKETPTKLLYNNADGKGLGQKHLKKLCLRIGKVLY